MLEKYKKNRNLKIIGIAVGFTIISRIILYLVYRMDYHIVTCIDFENTHLGGKGLLDYINSINIWDSAWYNSIVFNTYTAPPQSGGQAQWAFFPLLPLIVKFLCMIFRTQNSYLVVYIFNTVALILLCIVSYKYILVTRQNDKQAIIVSLLLTNGPFSYFTLVFYTETLFLLLLVCCLYFMRTERFVLMGMCGALLSATRNVGVFFCIILLLYWLRIYVNQKKYLSLSETVGYIIDSLKNPNLVLGTFMIPLGLFCFMLYLKLHLGDAYAFVHVQRGWHKVYHGLIKEVGYNLLIMFPPDYRAVITIVAILLCLMLILNNRIEEAFLPLFLIIVSGSETLTSIQRYIWGTYTVLVAFTDCMMDFKKKYRVVMLIFMIVYEVLMFLAWLNGNDCVF